MGFVLQTLGAQDLVVNPKFKANQIFKFKAHNVWEMGTQKTETDYQVDLKVVAVLPKGYGLLVKFKTLKTTDTDIEWAIKLFEKIEYPIMLDANGRFEKIVDMPKILLKTRKVFDSFVNIESLKYKGVQKDSFKKTVKFVSSLLINEGMVTQTIEEIVPLFFFNGGEFNFGEWKSDECVIENALGGRDFPAKLNYANTGTDVVKQTNTLEYRIEIDPISGQQIIKETVDSIKKQLIKDTLPPETFDKLATDFKYDESVKLVLNKDNFPIKLQYQRNYRWGIKSSKRKYTLERM